MIWVMAIEDRLIVILEFGRVQDLKEGLMQESARLQRCLGAWGTCG